MGITYRKEFSFPAGKERRKTFDAFGAIEGESGLAPARCRGFLSEHGALRSSEGLGRFTMNDVPSRPVRSRTFGEEFFVYCEDQKLYLLHASGFEEAASFSEEPCYAEATDRDGKRIAIFASGTSWTVFDGETWKTVTGPNAVLMAFHYERLFVWDGEKLLFSEALDPFGWEEGLNKAGWVELPSDRSAPVAMLSFRERLYLFRDRSVTVIRAFGDNRYYKATEVPLSSGKVIAHTVVNGGDDIVYCAEDGIYRFDGEECALLDESEFLASEASCALGRYIVSGERGGEKALFVILLGSGRRYLLETEAIALSGKAFYDGSKWLKLVRSFGNHATRRVWDSGVSDFGFGGERKLWKKLALQGSGEVSVRFSTERGTRCFHGYLPAELSVNLRGKRARIVFEAHEDTTLSALEVTVRGN
ncbi:MAG: hypothetical protein ACI4U2_00365 [Christensenellaceae bacterium]